MKSKIFSLMSLSIFALVLFMSFASAGVDFVNVTGNSQTVETGENVTITFQLEEDGYGDFTNMSFNDPITLTLGSDSFNSSSVSGMIDTSLNQSETSEEMSITFDVPEDINGGEYTGTLTLTGDYTGSNSYDLPISITVDKIGDVCDYDDNTNLDMTIEGMEVKRGFGDEDEWFPFDLVEVEIDLENNGADDMDDIVVEWALYDKETGKEIVDGKEDKLDIKDGDDDSIVIEFKLDDNIDDLNENGDYVFYVWATGEDQEFDGDKTCISDYESIDIIIENDFVVLDDIEFLETISCGSELQVSGDVWNIGEDDQDDVYIRIYNKDLGIDKEVEMGDIDSLESEGFDVLLDIPEDVEEKYYTITFMVYDEDDDMYENDYDDDKAEFMFPLKVEGNCVVDEGIIENTVIVSASLVSGGKAGEELVVKATITNIGDESATYIVNAAGYADWAKLAGVDPSTVVLDAGEFEEITFTFNVNKDISGDKLFDVEVISGTQLVKKQPVSISIEDSKLVGFLPGFISDALSDRNAVLWGLGILNIVLVFSIILVAIKVARK